MNLLQNNNISIYLRPYLSNINSWQSSSASSTAKQVIQAIITKSDAIETIKLRTNVALEQIPALIESHNKITALSARRAQCEQEMNTIDTFTEDQAEKERLDQLFDELASLKNDLIPNEFYNKNQILDKINEFLALAESVDIPTATITPSRITAENVTIKLDDLSGLMGATSSTINSLSSIKIKNNSPITLPNNPEELSVIGTRINNLITKINESQPKIISATNSILNNINVYISELNAAEYGGVASDYASPQLSMTISDTPNEVSVNIPANQATTDNTTDNTFENVETTPSIDNVSDKNIMTPEVTKPVENVVTNITYAVQPGDSLSSIANKYYGDSGKWREIYEANRDFISNPNIITTNMVLTIPGVASAVASDANTSVNTEETETTIQNDISNTVDDNTEIQSTKPSESETTSDLRDSKENNLEQQDVANSYTNVDNAIDYSNYYSSTAYSGNGFEITTGNKTYELTDEQLKVFYAVVASEAAPNKDDALAVASVALNIYENLRKGPDLFENVITNKNVFEAYGNSNYYSYINGTKDIPDYIIKAVDDCVLHGVRNTEYNTFRSNGSTKFSNNMISADGNRYSSYTC